MLSVDQSYNKMKNLLLLISFLLVFSSCTTPVFLTRTVPPELELEKKPARIVFSNQFDYRENSGIKDKHEEAYRIGIEEFGKALVNETSSENSMVVFTTDTNRIRHTASEVFESEVSKNEISSLCREHRADFLLSLDSLRLYFDWEVIREEDPADGSVSKTKDFYLFNNYYVTLYDASGEIIERTLLERSIYYSSRPTIIALITIVPNLDNAREKIRILAHDTGMEYIGLFYPSEETYRQRELYTGKVFKETNSLILTGQYDQAIKLLQEMQSLSNPKLLRKINHNLNVATEMKANSSGRKL